jgi:endonuclease YncB( thermonuclease family)
MYPLIFAVFLILLTSPGHAVELTGKPQVIDGDTIEISGERIRLHGIDAPETKQYCADENGKNWRCGQNATWALARIIYTHWVRCEGDMRDRYGRLIAKCFTGPYDVQAKRVRRPGQWRTANTPLTTSLRKQKRKHPKKAFGAVSLFRPGSGGEGNV